jgi:hypothetical protein
MPNILEVLVSNLGPHTSCSDHLLAVILRSFGKLPPQHLKLCHYKFHILPSSSLTDPIIGRFLFESLKTLFNKPHTKLSLPTPRRHMRPYLGTRRKWSASRLGRLIPGKISLGACLDALEKRNTTCLCRETIHDSSVVQSVLLKC